MTHSLVHSPPIFDDPNHPEFKPCFEKHGFVILSNAVEGGPAVVEKNFWKDIGEITAGSTSQDNFSDPGAVWLPSLRGIMSTRGIVHGRFAWKVKQSERVKQAFATLFDEQDLVVSMDCVIADRKDVKSPSFWLHKDQWHGD